MISRLTADQRYWLIAIPLIIFTNWAVGFDASMTSCMIKGFIIGFGCGILTSFIVDILERSWPAPD